MFSKNRMLVLVMVLAAVLMLSFALAGIVSAGSTKVKTICVDGYVINHRELAVDATKLPDGLKIEAKNENGQSVFADVDSKGYFKFKDLPVGSYDFLLQLPAGWDGIVPQAERGAIAKTGLTKFDEKDGCYRIVFKIRRLFDLTVLKWEEFLNGTVQEGADWEIVATPVKDPYVQPQTEETDATGKAQFTLTPGKWVITEKVKKDWVPVTPSQVTIELDQYAVDGAMAPVIFKNREPVCHSEIVVTKLGFGKDTKDTEVQLGPLAGWKITVARADKTMPPITKFTDGSGVATFAHLPPGVYNVWEQIQAGWESMADDPDEPQTVIHRDCETTEVIFKNREIPGDLKIYGYKLFKGWEWPYRGHPAVGLSSWVMTATLVGTEINVTTTTNALGKYEFSNKVLKDAGMAFPGATIEVCEADRDNWIHVTPECVKVKFPYPVPPGYKGVRVDFVNAQDPPVTTAVSTAAATGGCSVSHVVQRGETLARIAAAHGTSAAAIARASGIANANIIRTGQVLCVR